MENSVAVFAEPDESIPGKWQVVIRRGESDVTFFLASGLTKKAAFAHLRTAALAASFCGAAVVSRPPQRKPTSESKFQWLRSI